MFFAMHNSTVIWSVPVTAPRVRSLYGHITLCLFDTEGPARDFIDRSLGLFGQKRSRVFDRADLDVAVANSASRKTK